MKPKRIIEAYSDILRAAKGADDEDVYFDLVVRLTTEYVVKSVVNVAMGRPFDSGNI